MHNSLKKTYNTSILELHSEDLPDCKKLNEWNSFPAIHGTFGEDGRLQALLDNAGLNYAGSDARSSRVCMNKSEYKNVVSKVGVRIVPGLSFFDPKELDISMIIREIGSNIIIKPIDQGSSVDLHVISGEDMLAETLERISVGHWIIEKRILDVNLLRNSWK